MNNNAPLLSVDKTAKHGNYAHFPASGPFGETCSRCAFQVPDRAKFVCSKFQKLTGKKGKPIDPNKAACRYFEPRPAFNSVKG